MDLLAGYGSESDSEEEIVKETKQEVKPKLQFDLPKPSNVPLTDLALPEDIIIEDDEPIVDEKQQKALLFAQIEQEEERSFPARKSSSTASSSSLFSQLPTPKAKQETTKFSLFSSLPAPKEGKAKDELSLPEAKRKTQEDYPQDDSDDEEDRKRPFKKPTIEEGPLSFLPAPKRESAILEEPKPRAAAQQPIIEKPVIQQQQPEQPVKIVKQESEEDKIKKEKQQQMQRQKSQQKQQFFRNLVQNSVTTPVVQQKEQVEALPEVQPEEQQEMQQQQAYVDPMYTGGFNFPAYVDPATMNSRESRVFTSGNVQFVDVNMNQLKQGWTRAGYSEPIVSSLPAMRDGGKVMPSRDAKRQGHISHLVWDLHQKLPELESKRAEGAKKKKESRLKYGF